ncbi:MAG: ABC transporter permease subunit [Acidimicrobiia bacterium]|nr:ABC transporter permease subunit [Acidimicrobiia bacterium]
MKVGRVTVRSFAGQASPVRRGAFWLSLPVVFVLLVLFLIPFVSVAMRSLQSEGATGLGNYQALFASADAVRIVGLTLVVVGSVVLGCVVIGFAIAFHIRFSRWKAVRLVLYTALVAPFFVSVTMRIFGWLALMSSDGPLVTALSLLGGFSLDTRALGILATALALIQIFLPFVALPVLASLTLLDDHMLRAAQSLGAGFSRRLRKVVVPMAVPGLLVGSVLVIAQAIGAFFVPDILGRGFLALLPNIVVRNISLTYRPGLAAASAMVLTLVALGLIGLLSWLTYRRASFYRARRLVRRSPGTETVASSSMVQEPVPGRGSNGRIRETHRPGFVDGVVRGVLRGLSVLGVAILIVPLVATLLLAVSGGHTLSFPIESVTLEPFSGAIEYPGYLDALKLSVALGLGTVAVGLLLGIAGAFGVRGLGKSAGPLQLLLVLPVVLPSLAYGLGLFTVASDVLRANDIGSWLILLFGHVVLAIPFTTRTLSAGIEQLDVSVEKAAKSLGAGGWYRFRRVLLPMLIPSIAAGGLFAFWVSFDNFTISYFFDQPGTRTIPVQLLVMSQTVVDPRLAAGATLLLLVTVPIVLFAWRFDAGSGGFNP